jgi:hypothetical protein
MREQQIKTARIRFIGRTERFHPKSEKKLGRLRIFAQQYRASLVRRFLGSMEAGAAVLACIVQAT